MTFRNDLIQATRTWAKSCLGLTDAQIVPVMRGSTNKYMRLSLPYLTVNLTVLEIENGVDMTLHNASGRVTVGNRYATLRLTGYGEETEDWLRELTLRLDEYNQDYGTLVNTLSGVMDVSQAYDEHIEHQYVKDIRLDYRVVLTLTDPDNPSVYADKLVVDTLDIAQHLEVTT
jgi:hypothetical protein